MITQVSKNISSFFVAQELITQEDIEVYACCTSPTAKTSSSDTKFMTNYTPGLAKRSGADIQK